MATSDTSYQTRQRQLDTFTAMTGNARTMLAVEMAELSKSIALEGIRSRNPNYSDSEIHQAWLRILHGDLANELRPIVSPGTS